MDLYSGLLWCLQVKARTVLWNRPRMPPPKLWSVLDTSAFHGRVATILPDQHVTRLHLSSPSPPPNFKPIRPVTFTIEAVFLITLHNSKMSAVFFSRWFIEIKICVFLQAKILQRWWLPSDKKIFDERRISNSGNPQWVQKILSCCLSQMPLKLEAYKKCISFFYVSL